MANRRAVRTSSNRKSRGATGRTRRAIKRPARAIVPVKPAQPRKPQPPAGLVPDKNARFDSRLDRRIIEGMLHDRDALMTEMGQRGINDDAVLRRAAELGLSEALIRQVKGVAADLAGERPGRKSPPPSLGARTCLCCDRVFLSAGPGNRLCMRCRGGDAGLAQL